RVFRIDPDSVEAGAPPRERPPLPNVPLVSFAGDTTALSDYRGKALLVNFWASWCAPCRKELPKLKEYYGTLDRDRVEFLAISVDEERADAVAFIEPFDPPFPLFYGGPGMQNHFHYLGLPFTLIVDARGRIVEEIHGFGSAETWEYLTETLEAEMPPAASEMEDHDHDSPGSPTGPSGGHDEHGGHASHEPDAGGEPHGNHRAAPAVAPTMNHEGAARDGTRHGPAAEKGGATPPTSTRRDG
ncbi:MAG: TlpA disulfide reductase family protein, partial [Gemmatimonadota bacterium]|nr:TlpA disulfide reductase family protein [Gemmatimonadota bacterium]